tara:strand:- start:96 stop:539 length:444 start_codon:yes stop_codon:yes gene_type:complete
MKENELSPIEKLDIALQSHRFYNQECQELEKKINKRIDVIFQTEEAGVMPEKEDIAETVKLVNQLLTLSTKYIREGNNVVEGLGNLNEKEKQQKDFRHSEEFMDGMKESLMDLNTKQVRIHERVEEIQKMLIEMYNLDQFDGEDYTF